MRTINLDLPDTLHEQILALAEKHKVSINLIVATALAEKLLMLSTEVHPGGAQKKGFATTRNHQPA